MRWTHVTVRTPFPPMPTRLSSRRSLGPPQLSSSFQLVPLVPPYSSSAHPPEPLVHVLHHPQSLQLDRPRRLISPHVASRTDALHPSTPQQYAQFMICFCQPVKGG